ncbi:uncharacterized protein ColSpa_07134 [Colletotrichum spaethianum]|uniref:Uncharacterized protein n=1 Tax=Colletotrichum spaethianum TaxID=700344 RepID=A0AA37LI41_9PEZI|nr:uncharacterized protein ColSpa_07134 [Colletotrichum spaethianum]GKT46953.1 hypothetical protein ColSpa_07134 [Colletotrichum spaethianum]
MSRATMRWTPEVDQNILVAIVKTMIPSGEQYSAIIEELHSQGYSFTASALKCAFPTFLPPSFHFCLQGPCSRDPLPLLYKINSIALASRFSLFLFRRPEFMFNTT